MAVSILQQPDEFALTKGGRLQYTFSGNGRLVNTGTLALSSLITYSSIPDGTVINLFWKGKSLKMVARDNPVEPYEFPSGDGTGDHLLEILPYFRDYYPIESDFIVTAVPTPAGQGFRGLVFTARKPGPEYNLAQYGGDPAPYAIVVGVPGLAPTYRTRYSVYVEVFCKRDGDSDYQNLFTGPLEFDDNGRATLDLATTLHGHLEPDLPYWHTALAKKAELSAASYYIRYAEAWGEPIQAGRVTQLDPLRVYWGGMPYEMQSRFRLDEFVMPATADSSQDRLLRNSPPLRYIRTDEHQYLTFLNCRQDRTGVIVSFVVTLDNGQQISYQNRIPAVDIKAGEKVIFPVGLPQVKLAEGLPAGTAIREYTARIVDGTGFLSIPYRFVVNYRYQAFVRYFAFISSLGAPDTMTTFGKGSRELALFREEAEKVLPQNYELSDGQFVEYDTAYQQQFEVATGWRSESELRQLNDFYRANRRWRIFSDRVLPIGVTSKSIKQKKDDDQNFAHKFDYVNLFRDEFFFNQEEGDPLPPLGFTPSGSVTIQPVTPTVVHDNSVPDVVREITPDDITNWNEAAANGDHAAQGYLTQLTASPLFAAKNHTHPWSEITDKPDIESLFNVQDLEIAMTDAPVNGELELSLQIGDQIFDLIDNLLPRIFPRLL